MNASKKIIGRPDVALVTKGKLAHGCTLCFGGQKSVVFITGLCKENCYYCPVNKEYLHKDILKVNERVINLIEEIPSEISRSASRGASITGGDPLLKPEKTLNTISLLKSVFGSRFHIHLYTTGRDMTVELARSLEKAGLDELRFHPVRPEYLKKIELFAKYSSIDFGIEVPVIPNNEKWILHLALFLERVGGKFLNLNELEVSPDNYYQLITKGFKVKPGSIAVEGSYLTAINVMKNAIELGLSIPIHFCPAIYKDKIQTRMRFLITSKNSSEIFEEQTMEGTLQTILVDIKETKECSEKINYLLDEDIVFIKDNSYKLHPKDFVLVKDFLGECLNKAFLIENHPDRKRTKVNESLIS